MSKVYNAFAGKSVDRLAALSDGIFAVAMTLLVLDLGVPAVTGPHELDLLKSLGGIGWNLLTYLMSFLTLGIFWVGQQAQLNLFARSNRDLTWIHLGFLLAVTLMPFSTRLLAAFLAYKVAVGAYWLNIFLLGAMLLIGWQYANHAGLVKDDVTDDLKSAVVRRIVFAQALYAFGALLCLIFPTVVSIVFIALVQLNYVFAPRIRPLYRL